MNIIKKTAGLFRLVRPNADSLARFSARNPPGRWVMYREVMPDGRHRGTKATAYRVKSLAFISNSGHQVCFLHGKSGYVLTSHCVAALWFIVDIHDPHRRRVCGPFVDPDNASAALGGIEPSGRRFAIEPQGIETYTIGTKP